MLSSRVALQTSILRDLEQDSTFLAALATSSRDHLVKYIISTYKSSEDDAEEALDSFIRRRQYSLTSRGAQKQIKIPGTSDNPLGKTVELKQEVPAPAAPAPEQAEPTIDASPASSEEQKVDDVIESVTDDQKSRQQQLINAIKAIKITVNDLAKAMYGIELTEESQGKVVQKVIESISDLSAEQTADTVKNLASPLIGPA